MPSETQGTTGTIPQLGSSSITSRGRFELPVLAPLDSLTAGTSIPPPPPSPPLAPINRATTAGTQGSGLADLELHRTKTRDFAPVPTAKDKQNRINAQNNSAGYIGAFGIKGSSAAAKPSGPASPNRPSSIRRFLSRKSLNQNYQDTNGSATSNGNGEPGKENVGLDGRPDSPSAFSTTSTRPSISSNRSGSWFSRLMGGSSDGKASKRSSVIYQSSGEGAEGQQRKGPPPPQLPKLNEIESEATDGGMDAEKMFKGI